MDYEGLIGGTRLASSTRVWRQPRLDSPLRKFCWQTTENLHNTFQWKAGTLPRKGVDGEWLAAKSIRRI